MKKRSILLVMHGMPPKDFPMDEKREFMRLHAQVEANPKAADEVTIKRHDELDHKMREWPRNAENDAFQAASYQIAAEMEEQSGLKVEVGFNEFCAPTLEKALASLAADEPEEIVVITPMVTRGGSHSEVEIPEELDELKLKYPNIQIKYAWPFSIPNTAKFLLEQVNQF